MIEIPVFRKTFRLGLLLPAVVAFAWGAVFCACTDETDTTSLSPNHTAILNLKMRSAVLPDADTQATSATTVSAGTTGTPMSHTPMTRAGLEDDIKTVDVLVFKPDASAPTDMTKGTFFYRTRGRYETAGGQSYVRVELVASAEKQTLVVLVNARKQVDALAAAYGEQRQAVMSRLKLRADGTTGRIDINPADGMPMWGELTAQTVNESYARTQSAAPTVTLERMVAKVTFNVGVEHTQACHFYHGYAAGFIAPSNTAGVPTIAAADLSTLPYVDYSSVFPFMGDTSFYLFESDNRVKAAANQLTNSFFTIYITNQQAAKYWYRVDVMNYNTEKFLDILRNRHYMIELADGGTISTPGFATEEEAIQGRIRLKCRIVPWEEVRENFSMESPKRLSVDKREVLIPLSEMATGSKLTITAANNPEGWTISDITPGVTVSKQTSHSYEETILIRSTSRKGSFKIKSGNVEMKINVKRALYPLEHVAEFNLAGGFPQYGSSFDPSNSGGIVPKGAQTEHALRWATSHNNDESGYYNGYIIRGETNPYYNPSGKNLFDDEFFSPGHPGHGYHLPSQEEWTGVFSYQSSVEYGIYTGGVKTFNEHVEFGGIKKTFTNDYLSDLVGNVCYALRFKKWVDDSMAMPPMPPTSEFPAAVDNSMLCAYRYTLMGVSVGNTRHLKIDAVYLGSSFTGNMNTINNDAWWNAHASETVTRIFPHTGSVYAPALPGGNTTKLHRGGAEANYWSSTKFDNVENICARTDIDRAYAEHKEIIENGFPVRLFLSE